MNLCSGKGSRSNPLLNLAGRWSWAKGESNPAEIASSRQGKNRQLRSWGNGRVMIRGSGA